MGVQSLNDEIAQVPSQDGADQYFVPNIVTCGNQTHTEVTACN